MLTELSIHGIRGIDELHLSELSLVNVIAGDNGTGKTTIIEAATLLVEGDIIELARIQWRRGLARVISRDAGERRGLVSAKDIVEANNGEALFPGFVDAGVGSINGVWAGIKWETFIEAFPQEERVGGAAGRAEIEEDPSGTDGPKLATKVSSTVEGRELRTMRRVNTVSSQFLSTTDRRPKSDDASTLGDMRLSADRTNLQNLILGLQTIRPDIVDVEYIAASSGAGFYVSLSNNRRIPLGALGGGASALFRYLLAMQQAAGGILAIDEVEGGFHYSRIDLVMKTLLAAAKISGTQIFCTTHSSEVLTAIAHAAEAAEGDQDLSVISTYRDGDGKIAAQVYSERDAIMSLKLGYELR